MKVVDREEETETKVHFKSFVHILSLKFTYNSMYILNYFCCNQDIEVPKHRPKKPLVLPRSDSIGSASGRKYLAPTLSDPASVRTEKDKIAVAKKRNSRPPCKSMMQSVAPFCMTIIKYTHNTLNENIIHTIL